MGAVFMGYNYIHAKKNNYPAESVPTLKEFATSFARAFLTLLLPVIIMGGILSGVFIPTEAGVVAVAYAFFHRRNSLPGDKTSRDSRIFPACGEVERQSGRFFPDVAAASVLGAENSSSVQVARLNEAMARGRAMSTPVK